MAPGLTPEQVEQFGVALDALAVHLDALLTATTTDSKPVDLRANRGRLSRMDEMHNQAILLANRNVTRNRLREVRKALRRLQEGEYGYCLECDEPIAWARLNAYPEAGYCLRCQSNREQDDG